ncbi:MAG: V-type ATP synthase subunit I [Sedimentibacter sp.]
MAIEKMTLLQIVGSLDEMHSILKELVMCENVHLNLESSSAYSNNYLVHEYESSVSVTHTFELADYDLIQNECRTCLPMIEDLCRGLDIELKLDNKFLIEGNYSYSDAQHDLNKINSSVGLKAEQIRNKKDNIAELLNFKEKLSCLFDQNIGLEKLSNLDYFDFVIGTLSRENQVRIKKNYENLSAIVLKIGLIKSSSEDMYLIIYPKKYREETSNFLKSLSWNELQIPKDLSGNTTQMVSQIDEKVDVLKNEINELSDTLVLDKEENKYLLNRIFNVLKLEEKIIELSKQVDVGDNLFIFNVWVQDKDKESVEESLGAVTNKFMVTAKTPEELGSQIKPPTKLKNNWFTQPFEMIVKMYGLPSYHEIDPTSFLAVTFCLMFGIMFGDIGQGLVYFLAGMFLKKKIGMAGDLVMRLGGSSIIFGFVYGSLFGLEQAELPWLPSLVGKVLDPKSIPYILLTGVVVGIVVLTISYILGIINSLRRGDVEEGFFGKNGVVGYLFFMSMIMTVVAITKIINLPVIVPILSMLFCLVIMVFKEPFSNLVLKKQPLIHGDAGSYFTESIFECVETILNALSNGISFIRVGAFALNHAGLFLAFLVMSELTSNIVLKILILLIGNVLILTLEGLIVFIQGLRLQYYEMFSKYFTGDGTEFNIVKLSR